MAWPLPPYCCWPDFGDQQCAGYGYDFSVIKGLVDCNRNFFGFIGGSIYSPEFLARTSGNFNKNPEVDFGIRVRSDFKEYRNATKKIDILALLTSWQLYGTNGLVFAAISTRSVNNEYKKATAYEKRTNPSSNKDFINELRVLQKKNTKEFLKLLSEIINKQPV